jgi:hypothetical protein
MARIFITTVALILAMSVPCLAGPGDTISEGLRAWWSFDSYSGGDSVIVDDTGNGNELNEINGLPVPKQGMTGNSIFFDGESFALNKNPADSGFPYPALTITFWYNHYSHLGQNPIYGMQKVLFLGIGLGVAAFGTWGNVSDPMFGYQYAQEAGNYSGTSQTAFPDTLNKWTFVAITYNGAIPTMDLYRDGQHFVTNEMLQVPGAPLYQETTVAFIGGWGHGNDSGQSYFHGELDEVRVYNRVLSDEEIKFLFDNPSGVETTEDVRDRTIGVMSVLKSPWVPQE